MKTLITLTKKLVIFSCILIAGSCDSDDISPVQIVTLQATDITFNKAQLNASVDQVTEEIILINFILTTNIDGPQALRSFDITLPITSSEVSVIVKNLIPDQTYSYFLRVETENSELFSEEVEFTTSAFPVNEFSFEPNIGGAETLIEIEGAFEGFLTDPDIRFYFPQENTTWTDTYATGSIRLITENRCEYIAPNAFANGDFDTFNADLSIAINDKPYAIGKFQFTSRFYIEDEPPTLKAGETIRVVTENGRTDNIFEVNGQKLNHFSWLIANGTHENIVTIPEDFSPGAYTINVSTAEGNPLSLRPGPIYFDRFLIL